MSNRHGVARERCDCHVGKGAWYFGTKSIVAWPEERDGAPGYGVQYDDGYVSWSPEKTFEAAYQPTTALSFGHAIEAMKSGCAVARAGWNGKGMWLSIQRPDAYSKMTLPYIFMSTVQNDLVPWLASQTDLLAEDWCIVDMPAD